MALWSCLCLFPFPFHVLNWLSLSGSEQLLHDLEDKSRVLTGAEQKDERSSLKETGKGVKQLLWG